MDGSDNSLEEKDENEKTRALAKALDEIMDAWEESNNIDATYYEELSKGHFRSKTQ